MSKSGQFSKHTLVFDFQNILWYEHVRVGIKMDKSVVLQRQLLGTNQLVNVRQHLSDTFMAYQIQLQTNTVCFEWKKNACSSMQ